MKLRQKNRHSHRPINWGLQCCLASSLSTVEPTRPSSMNGQCNGQCKLTPSFSNPCPFSKMGLAQAEKEDAKREMNDEKIEEIVKLLEPSNRNMTKSSKKKAKKFPKNTDQPIKSETKDHSEVLEILDEILQRVEIEIDDYHPSNEVDLSSNTVGSPNKEPKKEKKKSRRERRRDGKSNGERGGSNDGDSAYTGSVDGDRNDIQEREKEDIENKVEEEIYVKEITKAEVKTEEGDHLAYVDIIGKSNEDEDVREVNTTKKCVKNKSRRERRRDEKIKKEEEESNDSDSAYIGSVGGDIEENLSQAEKANKKIEDFDIEGKEDEFQMENKGEIQTQETGQEFITEKKCSIFCTACWRESEEEEERDWISRSTIPSAKMSEGIFLLEEDEEDATSLENVLENYLEKQENMRQRRRQLNDDFRKRFAASPFIQRRTVGN